VSATLAIDVQGLTKRFGQRTVVEGLSMQVPAGQVWGFLGPNGSGKTTTIRMLCGLLRPDGGSGTCLGLDIVRESEAIRRQVGYMTQRFSFYEDLTIRENLEFVARLYALTERRLRVRVTLEGLGLTSRQRQLAGQLSGGWKQRLALAACMMHEPRLLLLDEPTAGVDPQARRDFWEEIHKLAGRGITVLVSTHYMDEAERCDRIVYLAYGRLLTQGTVGEVVARAGLTTWRASGEGVRELSAALAGAQGVRTALFGTSLHVGGEHGDLVEAAIAPWRRDPRFTWERVEPSLEDIFIHLMAPYRGKA
jgi:ABC-2 type transport system ATP-binding protein